MKESPQKSKKAGNAKETKQKTSAKTNSSSSARNTVETRSRKPKDAVSPNVSSSADQTAAGLLPRRNVQNVNSRHQPL